MTLYTTLHKYFFISLLLSLTSWASAQQRYIVLDHVEIEYRLDGKLHSVVFTGSDVSNEHLSAALVRVGQVGGERYQVFITPKRNIELQQVACVSTVGDLTKVKFFGNGLQSWTNSQEYEMDDKMRGIGKVVKKKAGWYGDYHFADYNKKKAGYLHSWTYTYFRQRNQELDFVGSLDEGTGYTSFQLDASLKKLTISKDCAGLVLTSNYKALDLFFAHGDDQKVFNTYSAAYTLQPTVKAEPMLGWTSWYHYYTKIDEDIILENLQAFKDNQVPIDLFQIDDGYQKSVGEWTTPNEKFPKGMKYIADEIHAAGYKAGIWLAPFICEKKSAIVAQHPDWLLSDEKGKPLQAGPNPAWSGPFYALDIYNPEVRAYMANTLDTIFNVWGFDMIKIDFMFAAAISPPDGKTRGEVMTDAMQIIRQLSKGKLVLGCGVPLGPAFGQVDYCRIGADIHMSWEHKLLKKLGMRERLSMWNSLTCTIGRRQLSGRFFLNDPDAFVLRSEENKLDEHAKFSSFLVNNLFGELVLTSDNIANYDSIQMQTYLSGFPYKQKEGMNVEQRGDAYEATFTIGDREYWAIINLGDKPYTFVSPEDATYFNNQRISIVQPKARITLEAHQSMCMYKIKGRPYELLGGKGYLFAGAEMKHFQAANNGRMSMSWLPGAQTTLPVIVAVPDGLKEAIVNGQTVPTQKVGGVNVVVYLP